MNKLKREELIEILEDFINKIKDDNSFQIPNESYLECFNKIESVINNSSFDDDDRFVSYGRISFLRKELTERLNDEYLKMEESIFTNKWDNRLGAFWDFYDIVNGDSYFHQHHIPKELNFFEISKKNKEYYKDGIICSQEKNMILDMINEMKAFITNKEDILKEGINSISIDVKEYDTDYVMILNNYLNLGKSDIVCAYDDELTEEEIANMFVFINEKLYKNFSKGLAKISENWKDTYLGDSNIVWSIEINENGENKNYYGNGALPSNWDDLIDLLDEYELIYDIMKRKRQS